MRDYKVYEDKFSSGYIGMLKKQKRYQQYLKLILKPGGPRPPTKKDSQHGMQQDRAESMYSDKGAGSRNEIVPNFPCSSQISSKREQSWKQCIAHLIALAAPTLTIPLITRDSRCRQAASCRSLVEPSLRCARRHPSLADPCCQPGYPANPQH